MTTASPPGLGETESGGVRALAAPEVVEESAGRRRLVLVGGLWNAASQLLPAAGVAVLSVVAARLLGAQALGRQSLIAYVNSSLSVIVVSSLGMAAQRTLGLLQGRGDEVAVRRFGAWMVRAHVVASLPVFAIVLGTGLLLHQDRLSWALIGFVTVVDAAVSGLAVRVAVRQGWVEVGKLQLVSQLIGAPLGVVGVLVGLGIPGIFGGDAIAAVGLLLVMVVRFAHTFPREHLGSLRPPAPIARSWLLFAMSALVFQIVARRVEFVPLAIEASDRDIATYSVAFMFVSLLASVPSAVAGSALPVIAAAEARGESDLANQHLRLAVRVGTVLTLPLTGLVAALGAPAVGLFYGHDFAAAGRLVPLASLVLLLSTVSGLCGQFWSGQGAVAAVAGLGAAAGVLDLAVAFGLVPSLGATGAVLANLIGQLSAAALMVRYTSRRLGGGFGWSVRNLVAMAGVTLAAAAAASGVVASVGVLMGGSLWLRSIVQLALGSVVALSVLAVGTPMVKVLSANEAAWLRPLLPGRVRPVLHRITVAT